MESRPQQINAAIKYASRRANRPSQTWMLLIPAFAFVLAAAHFMRWGETGLMFGSLAALPLLLWKKPWIRPILAILLATMTLRWLHISLQLYQMRVAAGAPWLRMACILGSVAAFTLFSSWIMCHAKMRNWFGRSDYQAPSVFCFFIAFISLSLLNTCLPLDIILFERFIPGGGLFQAFMMGIYAAWLCEKFMPIKNSPALRAKIWLLFSAVFFAQLAMGLAGFDRFLMTGKLHLPVPVLIFAGPVYRGSDFFMLFLFIGTVLTVGPAWCSHLCYIGAWEDRLRRRSTAPSPLPAWRNRARILIATASAAVAVIFRVLGISSFFAMAVAAAFGLAGIGIMFFISTRNGQMSHCTTWCPLGLLGNLLGRLSPFRISIAQTCSACMLCAKACPYDALSRSDILSHKAGSSCTLCGDCLAACHSSSIGFRFLYLEPQTARTLFIVIIVSLHAVFLAVARI